jgi:hypothetical protein
MLDKPAIAVKSHNGHIVITHQVSADANFRNGEFPERG